VNVIKLIEDLSRLVEKEAIYTNRNPKRLPAGSAPRAHGCSVAKAGGSHLLTNATHGLERWKNPDCHKSSQNGSVDIIVEDTGMRHFERPLAKSLIPFYNQTRRTRDRARVVHLSRHRGQAGRTHLREQLVVKGSPLCDLAVNQQRNETIMRGNLKVLIVDDEEDSGRPWPTSESRPGGHGCGERERRAGRAKGKTLRRDHPGHPDARMSASKPC